MTKAMSEMTDEELVKARWWHSCRSEKAWTWLEKFLHLILANQYDAEIQKRKDGK
jgi:hypothetical protein